MNFNDLLNDIENLLVGVELESINPSTPSVVLIGIDRASGKYLLKTKEKEFERKITELEIIFYDLNKKGFCNVEQTLYGSSSSRNHPETILANLPYIQHFKYERKKHLLFRKKRTHTAGTLNEVSSEEFLKIREKIDCFHKLSISSIKNEQNEIISSLNKNLSPIIKTSLGNSKYQSIESALNKLGILQLTLENSIVSLDFDEETKNINNTLMNEKKFNSIEAEIESPSYTGVDDGNIEESPFPPKEKAVSLIERSMRIRQLTPVLSLIYDRVHFKEIELQPDFQRKDRIWKTDKKSKLIESILMGLPLPVFYFAEKPNKDWIVVDGLQRVTTIYDFMAGKFSLKGLEVLGEQYDNKYFNDLSRVEQRDIKEYSITAHLLDTSTDKNNMIVELFHRINTYGVKLSDQEIRSALNQGTSVTFLRYLSSMDVFKKSTHGKVKPDRQKDMELCLSAISFMINGYENFGQKSYDSFLSQGMSCLNDHQLTLDNLEEIDIGNSNIKENASDEIFLILSRKFERALTLSHKIFGDICFIKETKSKKTAPVSKQLFELLITYFSELTTEQEITLLEKRNKFIDELYLAIEKNDATYAKWDSELYSQQNRGFMYSISTSTGKKVTVKYRFEAFREILKRSTGINVQLSAIGETK
ncbi:DUF262 domain-containing protein [Erwinia aphidicola]|uniref:DUF262 domain-containing protein n=1 Tax=Erwinia aphidicola TaxID=68334 RepID=UPI00209FD05D|nr:DUF262 domain-containing protein [Erwinia aphidicola]MCP2230636.1 hypothetical protein [Erwinia aphidicola]